MTNEPLTIDKILAAKKMLDEAPVPKDWIYVFGNRTYDTRKPEDMEDLARLLELSQEKEVDLKGFKMDPDMLFPHD